VNDDRRTALLVAAIEDGAPASELARMSLPSTYRAAVTKRSDVAAATALPEEERSVADTLHVESVPTPALAPDEALVAVMASSINYNTVWSSIFAPVPTFAFLDRLAAEGGWAARHGGDRHVLGSDAAGVVVAVGSNVARFAVGDHVAVHGNWVDGEDPATYADAMRSPTQRAWGFETNFGGLADLALVKASQLLPKPAHLTWEETASTTLCNATAYRMLISPNGANLRLGDRVLIWGATGGIGSFAVQQALATGAEPICVVSSPARAAALRRLGVRRVIDRRAEGYRFLTDDGTGVDRAEVDRFAARVHELAGGGVDVVFEHPGRETIAASIASCRPGGAVVTCAATTGYAMPMDAGVATTSSVRIIGSHFANYHENARANDLVRRGLVHPTMTASRPLDEVASATQLVRDGRHDGKVAITCLGAPGTGVTDPWRRAELGEDRISAFRLAVGRSAPTPGAQSPPETSSTLALPAEIHGII